MKSMNQKGFAPILILIAVIALVIGGYFVYKTFLYCPGGSFRVLGGECQFNQAPIPPLVACTQEAKICPDGSSVGRTGPNCEFKECPTSKPASDQTSCTSDSDCGVNTCGCIAQRKEFLGKNMCTQACVGEPKCQNNKCVLDKGSAEKKFCGGIAGTKCPLGYKCQLDGNYPDAGGKCVKE